MNSHTHLSIHTEQTKHIDIDTNIKKKQKLIDTLIRVDRSLVNEQ